MPAESTKAVFLSYASQDAEAAQRICSALHAAGVEVWFDQSELTGGDAWDAKIRKQIAECALFVPVISAATQARREGYFRLEWRLAAQRTHMMSEQIAFLLPVVIDATRDAEADVPGEFKAVQWTRLRPAGYGGQARDDATEKFCERVKTLLGSGEVARVSRPVGSAITGQETRATPEVGRRVPAAAWVAVAVAVGGAALYFALRPEQNAGAGTRPPALSTSNGPTTEKSAAASPADELVAKARALLDDDPLMTRANVVLAEQLSLQAIAQDRTSAEAHAAAAWANFRFIEANYEDTAQRRADLKNYADKARLLAPASVNAELATCGVLLATNNRAEATARLRALADRAPGNLTVLRAYAGAAPWANGINFADDENQDPAALARLRHASPLGRAYADSYLANQHWAKGEYVDAERMIDAVFAAGQPVRLTYLLRLLVLTYGWGDLPAAQKFVAALPSQLLLEDVFITHGTSVWFWSGDTDRALATLERTQREMLQEAKIQVPTGMFRGEVMAAAGRKGAATIQWQAALAHVEKLLAASPGNPLLHLHKAQLLAYLDQRPGAAAEFGLAMEIFHPVAGTVSWAGTYGYFVAIGDFANAIPRLDRSIARDNGRWPNDYNLLRYDPACAELRKDPRVQAILARGAGWLAAMRAGQPGPLVAAQPPLDFAAAKSIAVLAFKNLSGDPAREFFSDGLSEAVTDVLGRVPGLKVVGSASAFSFKAKSVSIPEIARQLGVTHLVEGTVLQEGQTVRITAKLIKADGFQVWVSDKLDRELKNIFALHDEVAGLIAKNLSLKLGASSAASQAAVNPQAYELYVQGRQAWNLRTPAGFDLAENAFTRALALEPNFARAHAALADVWIQRGPATQRTSEDEDQPNSDRQARIMAKITHALTLDPDSAEAHASLGSFLRRNRKPSEAESALRRAVALNPNYASAHQWLGRVLVDLGQMDEALEHLKLATELDPLSPIIWGVYGSFLNVAGRPTEGIIANDRTLALQPDNFQALRFKIRALVELGRLTEAVALVRRLPSEDVATPALQLFVFDRAGLKAEAEALLAARRAGTNAFPVSARSLLALGRTEEALALMTAEGNNRVGASSYLWDPIYDSVRNDPRWVKLMADAGLTEAHARAQAWRKAHPSEKPAEKK